MFVNIIKSCRDVVAICDSDLIGKSFEEGDLQLDVKENFYKGEEMSKDEAIEVMKNMSYEDATFNIVGEEAVMAALNEGIISEESIKTVDGVPFALVLL